MSFPQTFRVIFLSATLSLGGAGFFNSPALAQEGQASPESPGSIRQALEQRIGQRAKLKLVSGQDLEGKVAEVGSEVVIVAELTGMEFYQATVRLDQVAAVIVRSAGR